MTQSTALALSAIIGTVPVYDRQQVAAQTFTVCGFGFERAFTVGDYAKYYANVSFREGGWARSHLGGMSENVASAKAVAERYASEVESAAPEIRDAFDKWALRHISHWLGYIVGHGSQASAMITGPSNFPVRRQQKQMRWSDNRYQRIVEHRAAIDQRLKRIAYPHGAPGEAIRANNPDAPEMIRARIDKLEAEHAFMKRANKVVQQSLKMEEGERAGYVGRELNIGEDAAMRMLKPSYMGRVFAFGGYALTNNRANIKRLQDRLAVIERAKERGNQEHNFEALGFQCVENAEEMRIQLIFEGKPSEAVRKILKYNGFRWAPSQGAWQRHLNPAGKHATNQVIKALREQAS